MRYATKEEREGLNNYIKSISKPTGVNFFDTKEVSNMEDNKKVLYDNINDIQLSDKVNKIQSLPNIDNKDTVVQEIEALEIFTPEERASIFGNSNILWILKGYTIKELKEKATKALNAPEIHEGDLVSFSRGTKLGLVVKVIGTNKDRLTILYREVTEYNNSYDFIEGASIYDVVPTGKKVDISFFDMLK